MPNLPQTPVEVVRYLPRLIPTETEDVNEFFRILSNERRRLVIARVFVLRPFTATDANTLACQIAGAQNDEEPEAISGNQYSTVYAGLIQNHLPALADAQIIAYDHRSKRVSRGPAIHAAVVMVVTIAILCFSRLGIWDESSS